MSYEFLEVAQDEHGIVTVAINSPEAKNAVNFVMNEEFAREVDRIEADSSARVLIVTGTGTIFCSGGDIRQMTTQGKSLEPPEPSMDDLLNPHHASIRRVTSKLRQLTKPSIAAVNGPCIGSGIGIAAGCDIRIASRGSRFGWVFVRRGIVPDDGSLKLVLDILGYAKAFHWGVRGGTLSAAEALALGFVEEVVESEELLARAHALALEIVENSPPITVQLFKSALVKALDQNLEESIRFTERAQQIARKTSDHAEALRAYAEKRPPVWRNG